MNVNKLANECGVASTVLCIQINAVTKENVISAIHSGTAIAHYQLVIHNEI